MFAPPGTYRAAPRATRGLPRAPMRSCNMQAGGTPDHMDDAALQKYERALLALRDDLCGQIEAASDAGSASIDGRIGRSGDTLHAQQVSREMNRRREARLKLIPAALQRIKAGEFGRCASCRRPISTARLDAFPESLLCINCQSRRGC